MAASTSCDIGRQAAVASMAAIASGGAAAAARQRPVSSKGKLALSAVRVMVVKEYKELEAAMAALNKVMTGRLNMLFGHQHRHWSQTHLYDYTWLRDWMGVSTLKKHLPEIAESFKNQYEDIGKWTSDVRKYKKVMDPEHVSRSSSQWMMLTQFLSAVEAADDMLIQMEMDEKDD